MTEIGGLIGRLEQAAASGAELRFIEGTAMETVSGHDLWLGALRKGSDLRARVGEGGRVAMVLGNSRGSIEALVGALAVGVHVVSLPLPARGADALAYVALLEDVAAHAGAELVAVESRWMSLVPELRWPIVAFEALGRSPVADPIEADVTLTQCTSGTSAAPRGVVLGLDAIEANILAILRRLQPRPGEVVCSWLPLSHDMGLVGMVLASMVAGGHEWVGGGMLVLSRPEDFVASPGRWMQTCSDVGATFTAAPDFAWRVAARSIERSGSRLDLSSLRIALVGSEMVRPGTLSAFERAAETSGFDGLAFCPAYGLAEVGVGVSIVAPEDRWREAPASALDPSEPDEWGPSRGVVSNGSPLDGYQVRVDQSDAAGEPPCGTLVVEGPSLLRRYTDEPAPVGPGGLATADRGTILDGEVYVLGREDEIIVALGRKLNPLVLEGALCDAPGLPISSGKVVVCPLEDGYAVVAEHEPQAEGPEPSQLLVAVDAVANDTWGLKPAWSAVVAPRSLPKTASGKLRRRWAPTLVTSGALEVVERRR